MTTLRISQAKFVFTITLAVLSLIVASRGQAQLILNEANTVDADGFLQVDFSETEILNPYEGFDYGIVPYSGNTNPPDGANPGNPYPSDLDTGLAGNQITLPNGWNGTSGWGRILGAGGDWYELVVTEDHTDLRGYTLYVETDDPDSPGLPNSVTGEVPSERQFVKFTRDKSWADLRAGTIITISEQNIVDEIRDDFPFDLPEAGQNDTGHNYNLNTNLAFNPFSSNDWHIHFHVDEDITKDENSATQYFEAQSDVKGHNRLFRMAIFNSTNTSIAQQAENPAAQKTNPAGANYLDLTTGLVQGLIGENGSGLTGFGSSVPGGAGGVGGDETLALTGNPASGIGRAFYEDVDWTSFGLPNVFNTAQVGNPNAQDDSKLGGVQDFSTLRNPVLANTYDWSATGSATFGTAGSWQNADTAVTPASGPDGLWTARLMNDAGGSKVAEVLSGASIKHGVVMASNGSMTLEVKVGATLSVGGTLSPYDYNSDGDVNAADYTVWRNTLGQSVDLRADGNNNDTIDAGDYTQWKNHYGESSTAATGRLLVMEGGTVHVDGTLAAGIIEAFDGGTISGNGTITGQFVGSGGTIAPGSSAGLLHVTGNYSQDTLSTLEIELGGAAVGQFDRLTITGTASLAGSLEIALIEGFTPTSGAMFTILTASAVTENLTLTGAAAGFDLITNATSLVLHYVGPLDGASFSNGTNVPEPTTGLLAILAITYIAARRRRS